MTKFEKSQKNGWTSAFLIIAGIILGFSSVSFGQARASGWLQSQYESIGDTSTYQMVMEINSLLFVIFGSILFGTGILLALASMGLYLFMDKQQNAEPAELLSETEIHSSRKG